MVRKILSRRFRIEASVAFLMVALVAVAFFQCLRMQPLDVQIIAFYGGYVLASGALGYRFAVWYTVPDTSWFETISVPIVIALLATLGACLLLVTLDSIERRVPDLYAVFFGAMLLAVNVLMTAGLVSMVAGIGASVALRFRARAVACTEPNETMEPTR